MTKRLTARLAPGEDSLSCSQSADPSPKKQKTQESPETPRKSQLEERLSTSAGELQFIDSVSPDQVRIRKRKVLRKLSHAFLNWITPSKIERLMLMRLVAPVLIKCFLLFLTLFFIFFRFGWKPRFTYYRAPRQSALSRA